MGKVKSLFYPAKRADPGENGALFMLLESRIVTFLVELQSNREGDTRQLENTLEPKVRDNILAERLLTGAEMFRKCVVSVVW